MSFNKEHSHHKPENQELSKEYIEQAFQKVVDEQQASYEKHPRRLPVRVQRIWDVFKRKNYSHASLEELSQSFSNTRKSYNETQGAIAWLNKAFTRLGLDIEIERFTSYRIKSRTKK